MNKKISECLKKFTYRAEWSDEDGVHIARALEMPSIKAHGSSPEEAIKELKIPLEMALEMLLEEGSKLPEPISTSDFKGRVLLRMTPEKHKEMAMRAAESGISLNQLILTKIS